jgi:hypothetical protein
MNRREEPIAARARKKIKKEIRALVDTKEPVTAPRNTRGQALATRPKKILSQEVARKKALLKKMKTAKQKMHSHNQSKRVSPGTVKEKPSTPSELHKEGERWIKTTQKQNLNEAKRLMRKLSKNR